VARKKKQKPVTVALIPLGCPKAIVDSERMLAEIAQSGFLIKTQPETADVVVINTCAFIAPARTEALQAIKHAVDCKLNGTVKKVIVAGCLPQRWGRQLFSRAKGIDAIVTLDQRDNIASIIKKVIYSEQPAAFMDKSLRPIDGEDPKRRKEHVKIANDRTRLLLTGPHWAYLRISEGCDHTCSFCTIPAIRGPFRSKPEEVILAEAAELASAGVVELNIIAQDSAYYGRDLKIKEGLAGLAEKLEKIAGLAWIRLMYLYPSAVSGRLIDTVAASEKIVHYFDIPIQHINNEILKRMHRPDSKDRICRLIENLRRTCPDCLLRTTLMVGFPGESDRQFDELLEFVKWARFDALGCFRFYAESGTTAAQLPGQVPDLIKQQRLEQIMLTQQKIAFEENRKRIGTELTCLVDSVDNEGSGRARFYGQAPDIDSVCIVKNCSAKPGLFIKTKVIDTKEYDLIAKQI